VGLLIKGLDCFETDLFSGGFTFVTCGGVVVSGGDTRAICWAYSRGA
jgi:hypothetical protein